MFSYLKIYFEFLLLEFGLSEQYWWYSVNLLIEKGANINQKDGYKKIPFEVAQEYGNIRFANLLIRTQEMAYYLSMIKTEELPRNETVSLISDLYSGTDFNPYIARDIAEYAFGEEEKEGVEESKSDSGGRRKSVRKKSGSKKSDVGCIRRKSISKRRKKSRGKRKSVSRKYCLITHVKKMGFSQKASCKAQGLLKRNSKKNKGKYVVSPKYKKK